MMTDTVLKSTGMRILMRNLERVEVERFIALMIKDRLIYTKWQSEMFEGMVGVERSKRSWLWTIEKSGQ